MVVLRKKNNLNIYIFDGNQKKKEFHADAEGPWKQGDCATAAINIHGMKSGEGPQ